MKYYVNSEEIGNGFAELHDGDLDKFHSLIENDLKDIDVEFNNLIPYGGLQYNKGANSVILNYVMSMREDGKYPVYFVAYYDENANLRAFVPKKNNNLVMGDDGKWHGIYDNDESGKIYNITRILKEFKKNTIYIDKKPRDIAYHTNEEQFVNYINRFDDELINFVKCDVELGMYGVQYNEVKKITPYTDSIYNKNGLIFCFADIEIKNTHNIKGILYINERGGLQMYVPVNGNAIDKANMEIFKQEHCVYFSESKMIKEFLHLVNISYDNINLSEETFYYRNGIPYENIDAEKIVANRGKINVLEKTDFDFENFLKNKFNFDSFDIVEHGIEFKDVYVKQVDVSIDGYHTIAVFGYMDKNNKPCVTIPLKNNNLYKGELIPSDVDELPYINYDFVGADCFELFEEEVDLIEETYTARPYGFSILTPLIDGKSVNEVNALICDDIKYTNPKNEVTKYSNNKGLECYLFQVDEGYCVLYCDIFDKIRGVIVSDITKIDRTIIATSFDSDEDLLL